MQQVETKKAYVEPKMAELGNVSAITLGIFSGKDGGGSCTYVFVKHVD